MLYKFDLELCFQEYIKIDLLCQIVASQLSGGWRHNYPTKTRQAGHANEQSIYLRCLWKEEKSPLTKVNKKKSTLCHVTLNNQLTRDKMSRDKKRPISKQHKLQKGSQQACAVHFDIGSDITNSNYPLTGAWNQLRTVVSQSVCHYQSLPTQSDVHGQGKACPSS